MKTYRAIVSLMSIALAAGCGSSTEPKTLTMSQSDVTQLVADLQSVLVNTGTTLAVGPATVVTSPRLGVLRGVSGAPLTSRPSLTAISETDPCPAGGNLTASGTDNTTPTTDAADITVAFNGCKTPHYTIGGSLEFNSTFDFSSMTTYTLTASVKGTLDIDTTDGRSGSCPIDFSVVASTTSATVNGTVCGIAASTSVGTP